MKKTIVGADVEPELLWRMTAMSVGHRTDKRQIVWPEYRPSDVGCHFSFEVIH